MDERNWWISHPIMPNARMIPIATKPQFQKSSKMGLNHVEMPESVVVTLGVVK